MVWCTRVTLGTALIGALRALVFCLGFLIPRWICNFILGRSFGPPLSLL